MLSLDQHKSLQGREVMRLPLGFLHSAADPALTFSFPLSKSTQQTSLLTLRGPHTSASPGNAFSVSDVNNVALICHVTSGLSAEAKYYHLWKCCAWEFLYSNLTVGIVGSEEQLRMKNLASSTSPLFLGCLKSLNSVFADWQAAQLAPLGVSVWWWWRWAPQSLE